MRILPGVLKELLKHVPTVLFDAVEWSVLGQELPKLSRRLIQKEGYQDLFDKHQKLLTPFDIRLTDKLSQELEVRHDVWAAQQILTLYFAQIYSKHGLFLDLRTNHFSSEKPTLLWQPSGLWTKFSDTFSEGLHEIYDGFYLGQDEVLESGLVKLGLIAPHWSMEDRQHLADLFKMQFGSSISEEVGFELEVFKASLVKIADFLLEKKVKISTDFLYLGIYLVTLYSALEKTRVRVNVKQIYLKVKAELKS